MKVARVPIWRPSNQMTRQPGTYVPRRLSHLNGTAGNFTNSPNQQTTSANGEMITFSNPSTNETDCCRGVILESIFATAFNGSAGDSRPPDRRRPPKGQVPLLLLSRPLRLHRGRNTSTIADRPTPSSEIKPMQELFEEQISTSPPADHQQHHHESPMLPLGQTENQQPTTDAIEPIEDTRPNSSPVERPEIPEVEKRPFQLHDQLFTPESQSPEAIDNFKSQDDGIISEFQGPHDEEHKNPQPEIGGHFESQQHQDYQFGLHSETEEHNHHMNEVQHFPPISEHDQQQFELSKFPNNEEEMDNRPAGIYV